MMIILNEINGTVVDKEFETVEQMEKFVFNWVFDSGLVEWSIKK